MMKLTRYAFLLSLLIGTLTACGKRGALIPPEALVPAPVSNLAAQQKGNFLQVSWTAPTKEEGGSRLKDLAGFILFRRLPLPAGQDCDECPGAYRELARVDLDFLGQARRDGNRFIYDDFDLKAGQVYQYKVRSRTSEGAESRDSNKVRRTVFTPPLPPVLEAQASADSVTLSFVAIPPEAGKLVGYHVYRSVTGQPVPVNSVNATPISANTFEDKSLLLGQQYSYSVRTVVAMPDGEIVESTPSNVVETSLRQPD